MLLIDTEVKSSTIPNIGLGLFTKEPIKKGEIIWQINADVDCEFTEKDIEKLPAILNDYLKRHAYKIDDVYVFSNDNSLFMNHCDDPNIFQDFSSKVETASRDIEAGEELFCSYKKYDDDDIDKRDLMTNSFQEKFKIYRKVFE